MLISVSIVFMKKVPFGGIAYLLLLSLIMFCIAGLMATKLSPSPVMACGVTFLLFFGTAPLLALWGAMKKSSLSVEEK